MAEYESFRKQISKKAKNLAADQETAPTYSFNSVVSILQPMLLTFVLFWQLVMLVPVITSELKLL
eukprot:630327-Amphidinium_carterae.1